MYEVEIPISLGCSEMSVLMQGVPVQFLAQSFDSQQLLIPTYFLFVVFPSGPWGGSAVFLRAN